MADTVTSAQHVAQKIKRGFAIARGLHIGRELDELGDDTAAAGALQQRQIPLNFEKRYDRLRHSNHADACTVFDLRGRGSGGGTG
jgi:hypothetical protein